LVCFYNDSIIIFSNELFDSIPEINFSRAKVFYFNVNDNNFKYKFYFERANAFIEWAKIYEEPGYSKVLQCSVGR